MRATARAAFLLCGAAACARPPPPEAPKHPPGAVPPGAPGGREAPAPASFDVLATFSVARSAAASLIRDPRATSLAGQRAGDGMAWTWSFDGAGGEAVDVAVGPGWARVVHRERREYVRAPGVIDPAQVRVRPVDVLAMEAGKRVEAMRLSVSGAPPRPRWSVDLGGSDRAVIDAAASTE